MAAASRRDVQRASSLKHKWTGRNEHVRVIDKAIPAIGTNAKRRLARKLSADGDGPEVVAHCQIDASDPERSFVLDAHHVLCSPATKHYLSSAGWRPAMLRLVSFTLFAALFAIDEPIAASARAAECLQMDCRAIYRFTTCDKPRPGAKLLSGRVLALSRECSGEIIRMQVENWEAEKVPPVIDFVVQACGRFAGKAGDLTEVAVMDPRPDVRRYKRACLLF
ncbi:hypothetical protein [Rhodopseudomonas sp. P2A-2r]|uniref:hypothetical protein n=1 Tax=unclassified Rhodopseudomonas TaxID=2638247 RepID=UPI0022341E09|nr:hypothetical protein [Rhodopseudomonas sp. P2A-2r]UZE47634.1 hypothetical protein ONR75_22410 [Rhodopseudomonas sp. P2A-2r]